MTYDCHRDIDGIQKMNPNDFSYSLTFYPMPLADLDFHSSCEISTKLQGGLGKNVRFYLNKTSPGRHL